jgi:cation diffusion facilitator family transporter
MKQKTPHLRHLSTLPFVVTTLGAVLLAVKLMAYSYTHSTAVLSDAMEGIVNIVTGITSIFVMTIALRPADEDHPYGHGKIEYFSAAFEGGLIAFAALVILGSVVRSIIFGVEVQQLDLGLGLSFAAGLANGLMGRYLVSKGTNANSVALVASGKHLLSDFWTSMGVVAGLGLVRLTGWSWFDPITAMIVGAHLLYVGVQLVRSSVGDLMDAEDRKWLVQLQEIFERVRRPGVIRIHGTRTVRSGSYHHIDLHVVMPEFWSVEKAHDEIGGFERLVVEAYGIPAELQAHVDPCRKRYCAGCDLEPCPIRASSFVTREPLSISEMVSPIETDPEFSRS